MQCLKEHGLSYTLGRMTMKWKKYKLDKEFQVSLTLLDTVRHKQENHRFRQKYKISILTPLFNTNMAFLKEMIQSVQKQTYANWELCLCDGSDRSHTEIEKFCKRAAEADPRILYKKLDENKGISANTNACLELASGDYIALLDHDDILHPSALYEVMKAICKEGADFIYTDEAKFSKSPQNCFSPNFKPDYAKDDLRAHNYICHLTVYNRKLLEQVGHYNKIYDGSQDHEIVLRLTEKAKHIVHIPKVLYFWRVHKGSVSSGIETKPYAVEAAKKGVKAQLIRTKEIGSVSSITPYQTLYKVDYAIKKEPLVSVLIYGVTTIQDLLRCVKSVEDMTEYYPMEICIIEGSGNAIAFKKALRALPTVKPITVVTKKEQQLLAGSSLKPAIQKCKGDYFCFIHASAVVESHDWIKEMLMFAQRDDVGAVGAKLYDGNHAIYSAGLALDTEEAALLHHMYRGEKWGSHGYEAGLCHVRNVTAVSGRCLMISRTKLEYVGGLHEELGSYLFTDLCLRLRQAGYLNVCTPFATAVFGGADVRLDANKEQFQHIWKEMLTAPDPYYNPNIKKYMLF